MITEFEYGSKLRQCPACWSDNISPHIASVDYHYGIEGLYRTFRCNECRSIFLNPMPSVRDLSTMYADDYYSFRAPYEKTRLKRLARTMLRYPRITHVPTFPRPGKMLDVGCGAGQYLIEMRQKGWEVFGSELSEAAAQKGREAGIDIRGGELIDAGFEEKSFDFIRSNHSLEHMPNPDTIVEGMHRLLKDDGKLFIGVPNLDGWCARYFGKYWWNFGLPVHPINYTEKGICVLLKRNGFKVEKIIHNSDYSGLTGSLQICTNAKRGIRLSDGWIYNSLILRMPAHYLAKLIDLFRGGDCMEVICSKA